MDCVEDMVARADALSVPRVTDAQRERARALVRRRTAPADAAVILAHLGIDETADRPARPVPSSGVIHGNRTAVEWHDQTGTNLCGPCRTWVAADDRRRAREEATGA
jgi:hypothetical protein